MATYQHALRRSHYDDLADFPDIQPFQDDSYAFEFERDFQAQLYAYQYDRVHAAVNHPSDDGFQYLSQEFEVDPNTAGYTYASAFVGNADSDLDIDLLDAGSAHSADTPGLVTQSTDSASSNSPSPSFEPSEGSQVDVFNLLYSKRLDDSFTYPQVPKDTPPRSPHLNLAASSSISGAAGAAVYATADYYPESGPSQHRQRRVQDAKHTAQVRQHGACLRCRIERIKCTADGRCDKCTKLSKSHGYPMCIRHTLSAMGRLSCDAKDLFPCNDTTEAVLQEPRIFKPTGRKDVYVIFEDSVHNSPHIKLTLEQYEAPPIELIPPILRGNKFPRYTFPYDRMPSHDSLERWAEQHIKSSETASTFRNAIEILVWKYCDIGRGSQSTRPVDLPKLSLVQRVHRMNCMYRIWSHPDFYCYVSSNSGTRTLPVAIQASLRQLARKAMKSLELDILKDLDNCLFGKPIKKGERLALWASLWQLILIYGELLQPIRPTYGLNPDRKEYCDRVTEDLVLALVVAYGGVFRSKSHFEQASALSIETHSLKPEQRISLQRRASAATGLRGEFYETIQQVEGKVPWLLRALIVNNEVKKLGRRGGRRQQQSHYAVSATDAIDVDDDDDDEE